MLAESLDSRCGARSPKPQGWELARYPLCNRPVRHKLPHREYRIKDAVVLHEWWEAMDLTDRDIRATQRRQNAAERKRLYG